MNCGLNSPRGRGGRWRRGFTLLEVLVAVTVISAFLSGVYLTLMTILETNDDAVARLEACRNGRTALGTMCKELKQANRMAGDYRFLGVHGALEYGNGQDEDVDGQIDEEVFDGIDDEKTTQPLEALSGSDLLKDRHAELGTLNERPGKSGLHDLGDEDIDEDVVFGRDSVTFRIYPSSPTTDTLHKTITYSIGSFDGRSNVLLRESVIERTIGDPLVARAPLAFGVMGLDLLYWDPNRDAEDQYWVSTWDSDEAGGFDPPGLPLPASVLIRLELAADPRPVGLLPEGEPLQTLTFLTIVNISDIINDAQFPRPTL